VVQPVNWIREYLFWHKTCVEIHFQSSQGTTKSKLVMLQNQEIYLPPVNSHRRPSTKCRTSEVGAECRRNELAAAESVGAVQTVAESDLAPAESVFAAVCLQIGVRSSGVFWVIRLLHLATSTDCAGERVADTLRFWLPLSHSCRQ
jgi:hypothetical protein